MLDHKVYYFTITDVQENKIKAKANQINRQTKHTTDLKPISSSQTLKQPSLDSESRNEFKNINFTYRFEGGEE